MSYVGQIRLQVWVPNVSEWVNKTVSEEMSNSISLESKVRSCRAKIYTFLTTVRSTCNKFDEFAILLEDMKLNIFGVTESWLILVVLFWICVLLSK